MYDKNEALNILKYLDGLQRELIFLREPSLPQNHAELQYRLVALKERVKADHKELSRKSSKEGLTQAEQLFLSTALQKINSAFMIRTNTTPLSSKWSTGLQRVETEVSYFLDKVTTRLEKDA